MDESSNEAAPYTASMRDVCRHFGVSRNTVGRWLQSDNPPPHIRIGRQYRFNLAKLASWAESQSGRVKVAS